jgi:uncharacterized membrane protein YgcG
MLEVLGMYAAGVVTGMLVSWFVLVKRRELSPSMQHLAREAASQAVVIRATSDVVDNDTGKSIEQRANELYDEYDIPGDPELVFDPED